MQQEMGATPQSTENLAPRRFTASSKSLSRDIALLGKALDRGR